MGNSRKPIKFYLSPDDPMDSVILEKLNEQKRRGKYIKLALFCYIKGLISQPGGTEDIELKGTVEYDNSVSEKISMMRSINPNET